MEEPENGTENKLENKGERFFILLF